MSRVGAGGPIDLTLLKLIQHALCCARYRWCCCQCTIVWRALARWRRLLRWRLSARCSSCRSAQTPEDATGEGAPVIAPPVRESVAP